MLISVQLCCQDQGKLWGEAFGRSFGEKLQLCFKQDEEGFQYLGQNRGWLYGASIPKGLGRGFWGIPRVMLGCV